MALLEITQPSRWHAKPHWKCEMIRSGASYGNTRLAKLLTVRKDKLQVPSFCVFFYRMEKKPLGLTVLSVVRVCLFSQEMSKSDTLLFLMLFIIYRRFHSEPHKCFRYSGLLSFTLRQMWRRHRNKKLSANVCGVHGSIDRNMDPFNL